MAPLKALMVKPDKRKTILNGSTGIMGIKGDKGEEGSCGSSGSPGIRGVKGEQGSKGEKGEIVNSAETVFFCCCFFSTLLSVIFEKGVKLMSAVYVLNQTRYYASLIRC